MPLSTPTLVQPASGTVLSPPVVYGATVTRMAPLYRDTSDGTYKLGDANGTGTTDVAGIAVLPGASAEYGILITSGPAELVGTTLVKGMVYCLGPTTGEIVRETDLTAGCEVVQIGTALTTSRLDVKIVKTGIII